VHSEAALRLDLAQLVAGVQLVDARAHGLHLVEDQGGGLFLVLLLVRAAVSSWAVVSSLSCGW